MAYDDEKSQKPREMVHRAQANCANTLHRLRLVRQGVRDGNSESLARQFHSAVMLYWEQIKRFSSQSRIQKVWHNEGVVALRGYDKAQPLARLGEYRLRNEPRSKEVPDPETGGTTVQTVETAWYLKPSKALAVYDALDRLANELGFDARPARQGDKTGAGSGADHEPEPSEMQTLNSEVDL
jgi:protein-disulfide isomerase-like protein with CxxC motif